MPYPKLDSIVFFLPLYKIQMFGNPYQRVRPLPLKHSLHTGRATTPTYCDSRSMLLLLLRRFKPQWSETWIDVHFSDHFVHASDSVKSSHIELFGVVTSGRAAGAVERRPLTDFFFFFFYIICLFFLGCTMMMMSTISDFATYRTKIKKTKMSELIRGF